jgi:mannonate dehydratase
MRVAIGQFDEPSAEMLTFARQLGVSGVLLNTPSLPGDRRWEYEDLRRLRLCCEEQGLRLEALENTPVHFYDKAMLGLPGRDEQIAHYQATIRNMGRAGITVLGYHWMPNGVWRTSFTTPGRGGALVSAFDLGSLEQASQVREPGDAAPPIAWASAAGWVRDTTPTHGRVYGEDEMWQHYEYFMRAVLPVAEEAGVTLALHPDDPPVPSLGGIARLFRSFAGFKRAMELVPSPNSGLDFCMGCWSEMGPGVLEAIRYFGQRGKIVYVHFRDVQGTVPAFQECFLGEGNVDVAAAMRTLQDVGFDGFMIDDHVPHMIDDTEWAHRGRAYATGYMMGLLKALTAPADTTT